MTEAKAFLEGFVILQGMKINKKQVIIIEILDLNNEHKRRTIPSRCLETLKEKLKK